MVSQNLIIFFYYFNQQWVKLVQKRVREGGVNLIGPCELQSCVKKEEEELLQWRKVEDKKK